MLEDKEMRHARAGEGRPSVRPTSLTPLEATCVPPLTTFPLYALATSHSGDLSVDIFVPSVVLTSGLLSDLL